MDGPAGSVRACPGEQVADYQPPRVERVLTQADLQREILYAGPVGSPP